MTVNTSPTAHLLAELQGRAEELRPLVEEHARITLAIDALTNSPAERSVTRPSRSVESTRALIVKAITQSESPLTGAEISRVTGVRSPGVYQTLSRLLASGEIVRDDEKRYTTHT